MTFHRLGLEYDLILCATCLATEVFWDLWVLGGSSGQPGLGVSALYRGWSDDGLCRGLGLRGGVGG